MMMVMTTTTRIEVLEKTSALAFAATRCGKGSLLLLLFLSVVAVLVLVVTNIEEQPATFGHHFVLGRRVLWVVVEAAALAYYYGCCLEL